MTIKQAFEKLTAVTAAAMKNPFFVMRKLHDAFADIADKVDGGGGGSTVEVTQVLESGTKIATITVDDTPTDLYAPAASSQNYSTTEHVVGKWIDGTTDVYEKTQYGGVTFDGTNLQNTSFTNIDKVVSLSGFVLRDDEPVALGYFNQTLSTSWLCRDHVIKVMVSNNTSGETITFDNMTVRYTKVSS